MIRVYTASKLAKYGLWMALNEQWLEVHFHARWLKHVGQGTPDTPENAEMFWVEDEEDVANADALLVYAEPEDKLKGALVEVGMALSAAVPVIVVGEHVDYGTWQYHPGVTRVVNLEDAYKVLREMNLKLMQRHRSAA